MSVEPSVSGVWDIVVKTPMGDQTGRLTVQANGASFTGSLEGMLGSIAIPDGTVMGDTLRCHLGITSPMPMGVEVEATVSGDALTGTVDAGMFGSMPLTGTRVG